MLAATATMAMSKWQYMANALLFAGAVCLASPAWSAETSHLAFVTEYVRELSEIENARAAGANELSTAATEAETLLVAIHTGTVIQLRLRADIGILEQTHLDAPFEELIPNIMRFYEEKIALHQKMIDIASAFLAAPKPNVDYGQMVAEMPKLRALLDEVNRALVEETPAVFATLIDLRPDSEGHVSHLIITRSERDELENELTTDFGRQLGQKNQDYIVGAASVLYTYLAKKGYKTADEPY